MNRFLNTKIFLLCLIILNIASLTSLYSSLHEGGEFVHRAIFMRQLAWIAVFWLVVFIFSLINYRLYYDASYIIYGLNIFLLVAVKFFGKEIMGAQRWFSFFGLNFQPSEFSKVAIVILLARLFSQSAGNNTLSGWVRQVALPFFLVIVNSFLIFKQPDLGTAAILILLFFVIGFSTPIRKRYFVSLLVVGVLVLPLGWGVLKDYQKKRLTVFLNPDSDPLGAGYTIIQSKIAIGSGGLAGKGFLSGTQNQFNFLPERHTDFIFTVIAEEFGLAGCLFLLFVYYLILAIILQRLKGVRDTFAQLLCAGVYTLLFLHIIINVGMTMGLIPVVGLPLLFLSYGGTHLVISAILAGMFLNISRYY